MERGRVVVLMESWNAAWLVIATQITYGWTEKSDVDRVTATRTDQDPALRNIAPERLECFREWTEEPER